MSRKHKTRTCQRCEIVYTPTGGRQKYCPECKPIVEREKDTAAHGAKYGEDPEKFIARVRAAYKKDPEKFRTLKRTEYAANPEKSIARSRAWVEKNPERVSAYNAMWCKDNPQKQITKHKKQNAKRRALDFVPLNEPFEGCEAHHVDDRHIIYIPKTLHRSVYHNQWTGEGMEEINALAYRWLNEHQEEGAVCL